MLVVFLESIVEQLIACRGKHLRHKILVKIPEIGLQLVGQQLLVDDVLRKAFVPKSHRDEQAGVRGEQFISGGVFCQRQAHVRVIGMVRYQNSLAVFETDEHFFFFVVVHTAYDCAHVVPGGFPAQLGGNGHEKSAQSACGVYFEEVLGI